MGFVLFWWWAVVLRLKFILALLVSKSKALLGHLLVLRLMAIFSQATQLLGSVYWKQRHFYLVGIVGFIGLLR